MKRCRTNAPPPQLNRHEEAAFMMLADSMQHLLDRRAELTEDGTHALHLLAQSMGRIIDNARSRRLQ